MSTKTHAKENILRLGKASFAATLILVTLAVAAELALPTAYAADKGNDPVAYWRFDEGGGPTAYDDAGANDGTLSAGTLGTNTVSGQMWTTQGKIGGALECDGTDDYVSVPHSASLNIADTITLEAWIKPDNIAKHCAVLEKTYSTAWEFGQRGSGNGLHVHAKIGGVYYPWYLTSGSVLKLNEWQHIAFTFDGTTGIIYHNAELAVSRSDINGALGINSDPLNIGTRDAVSLLFPGLIDEVRIYNYARTPAQILVDYNAGSAAHLGAGTDPNEGNPPVGYWTFDENTGIDAYDRSGNGNDGTITNATWTKGKHGTALSFDGNTDYVTCGNKSVLDITGAITIESWVKPNSYDIHYPIFLIKQGEYYRTGLCSIGDGRVFFRIKIGAVSPQAYSSSYVPLNKWTHVVGVYDGEYMKVYLNGVLDGTPVAQTGNIDTTINQLVLGAYNIGGDYSFDGTIDEVKLYNYARTPAQIVYDYNKGKPVAHYKFDEGTGSIAHNEYSTAGSGAAAPVGWWRMDTASSGSADLATITDESGNGNNGTADNGADNLGMSWTTGKIGPGALDFDGVDDFVNVNDSASLDITGDLTLEAWVNSNTAGPGDRIISKATSAAGKDHNYQFLVTNAGKISAWFGDGTLYKGYETTGTPMVPPSGWHHIAIRYVGVVIYIYVDGVEQATTVYSTGATTKKTTATPLIIGTEYGGGYKFKGQIDDVRIYNYARTAAQIYNDYKTTHGTMVGDTKFVDGKIGKALSFDGNGDYVHCGSDTNLECGTDNWTFEALIKTNTASRIGIGGTYSAGEGYYFDVLATGKLRWTIHQTPTVYRYRDSLVAVNNNVWHHVAGVRDGDVLHVYIDGVASEDTQVNGGDAQNIISGANCKIGYTESSTYFNGLIDDVRIYNYARTAAQVQQDYGRGFASTMGVSDGVKDPWDGALPVGHWRLDENTGVLARDASENNNDGTLGGDGAGTDVPTWTQGKHGPGLSFDGGDYVMVGDKAELEGMSTLTIAAWIKTTTTEINRAIVAKYYTGTNSYCLRTDYTTAGKTGLSTYTTAAVNSVSTTSVNDDNWHHIVGTYDGTNQRLYIDGVLEDTDLQSGSIANSEEEVCIGDFSNGGSVLGTGFNGLIDDVKIYDYARTPAQIAWDYNAGKPVAHWRMDEATTGAANGQTIYDDSVHNNDGTANYGANLAGMTWTTGKFGGGLSFDGADDYVSAGSTGLPTGGNDRTIEFWVKSSNMAVGDRFLVGWGSGAINQMSALIMGLANSPSRKFAFWGYGNDFESVSTLNDDTWYHIGFVLEGTAAKLYLNGVVDRSGTISGLNTPSGTTFYIADFTATMTNFSGLFDDVRIYNYARTAEQVMQDYNQGLAVKLGE